MENNNSKDNNIYDVFISSKSEDYALAEKVYDFLSRNGLSVFLACKVLQKIGESEYAKSIDEALDHTRHMIVIATNVKNLESKWVQHEWSTFSNDLKSGYRTGNLLTILGDSIDKKQLPASLRHKQSFSFNSYCASILDYLPINKSLSEKAGVKTGNSTLNATETNISSIQKKDVNMDSDISISISDTETPIIVFIGPHSVGKTTILYRLIRHLIDCGYSINVERSFRPNSDTIFKKICDDFPSNINKNIAPSPTSVFETTLLDFRLHGIKVFQTIDTTGDLLSEVTPSQPQFPFSFQCLLNTPNPIIWLIVVDPFSYKLDEAYKKTISYIQTNRLRKDKFFIVLNKIETTNLLGNQYNVNPKELSSFVITHYPSLTQMFHKKTKISSIFSQYNCLFIPFQTGNYRENGLFVQSSDHFPSELFGNIIYQAKEYLPKLLFSKLSSIIRKRIPYSFSI